MNQEVHQKSLIYDINLDELTSILESWSESAYRAKQIWRGLYVNLWNNPREFTTLSQDIRVKINQYFSFTHLQRELTLNSKDKETNKTLFRLPDGQTIETVLMKYATRRTLCVTTQAGCAIGCVFCATGQMGFRRNLSSGEIIEQVLFYDRKLRSVDDHLTNIVFMGMGEPFLNYEATIDAIKRLNDSSGYNFGARRFTISTVGLIPRIFQFARENLQVNLAVSLHAADDKLRDTLVPINRKYPLEQLIDACRQYVTITKRRITFEWALIQDVNDSLSNARKLSELIRGLKCHVNIIPLNPTFNFAGKASSHDRAVIFRNELNRNSIPCTIRVRRGIDIHAGCGQLASKG